MPAFHTKTIESILEPVAQQISKLILQEDVEDDRSEMPDLSLPVQVVKKAADNLINVGYETCETSDDSELRAEMPKALFQVEEACQYLQQAATQLKQDPKSPTGKKSLISGERGILQGVSAILLRFDESEVRKIVMICRQALEYLSIIEVIGKLEDLVTYVKNFTPILAKMAREIEAREKELTHRAHRDKLVRHMTNVKSLTPSLVSAIKVCLFVNLQQQVYESNRLNATRMSVELKEYLVRRLNYEIEEIIHVLQLTGAPDDDQLASQELFKQKLNLLDRKIKHSIDLISTGPIDSEALKPVQDLLEEAEVLSDKLGVVERDQVIETIRTISSLVNNLCLINQDGQRRSSFVNHTTKQIIGLLLNMRDQFRSSADTINNLDQAKLTWSTWCSSPSSISIDLALRSASVIIDDAKKWAINQKDMEHLDEFVRLIQDSESVLRSMQTVNDSKTTNSSKSTLLNFGQRLQEKLGMIEFKMTQMLIEQVANDFYDTLHPIKKLYELVVSDKNQVELPAKFSQVSTNYIEHSNKLSQTARKLAMSGSTHLKNNQTADLINELARRIEEMAPQVVNAAYLAVLFDQNCFDNFDLIQKAWQANMTNLSQLIDESIDSSLFIKTYEKLILKEAFDMQTAVQEENNSSIITSALSIAKRTNRIIHLANQEAENSEDVDYVGRIVNSVDHLKVCLPHMIQTAKLMAIDPSNKETYLMWANSNEKLIEAIGNVKDSVSLSNSRLSTSSLTNTSDSSITLPDMNSLKIGESPGAGRSRQLNSVSKPTPLPDLIEENESDFPAPESNQPILLAAHDLHVNVNQWQSIDNDMIAVAKRITLLMARLSELVRQGSKKELIATAKLLADESFEISRLAKLIASDCTDKRMRLNLLQVSERIPTIGTQLKILSTVKATMIGYQGSKEDEEATEMLILNAQNLNASVKATVQASKSASIKLRTNSGLRFRWIRK